MFLVPSFADGLEHGRKCFQFTKLELKVLKNHEKAGPTLEVGTMEEPDHLTDRRCRSNEFGDLVSAFFAALEHFIG